MSITIYEKTPSGLYATGDRTVSTFPSGLVRVDQTFVCKTSAAATHRAALAVGTDIPGGSAPAIDGLKIFPEPQERKRDDGFTEFIVSAYGRTNSTGKTIYEWKFFSGEAYSSIQTGENSSVGVTKSVVLKNKLKKVQRVVFTSDVDSLAFDQTGATLPEMLNGQAGWGLSNEWYISAQDFSSQQYGHFTEISYIVDVFKSNLQIGQQS